MPKNTSQIEVRDQTVTKYFTDPEEFARELAVYQRRLSMTPQLLDYRKPEWILLQRFPGKPYLDYSLAQIDIPRLAESIATFHRSTLENGLCLCHWDNQPRNILYDPKSFMLIDFAESRIAHPEDDITHLLLFWASEFTTTLMTTSAKEFIQHYNHFLQLHPQQWQLSLEQSIMRFDHRRTLHCHSTPRIPVQQVSHNRLILADLILD